MIVEPIVVLGAPRSGTTLIQRCLALHPALWHLPAESHTILEGPLHPRHHGYQSNRVEADDLPASTVDALRAAFERRAINLDRVLRRPERALTGSDLGSRMRTRAVTTAAGAASRLRKPAAIRFLEKTPKNTLRIPFLLRLFPDARFVWIERRPRDNVDSLIAAWHATERLGPFTRPRFARAGYPIARTLALRDYDGPWWKFALVPGWRRLHGTAIADVALWQYYQCTRIAREDLGRLPPGRVFRLSFEAFLAAPAEQMRALLRWAGLPPSAAVERFAAALPPINATGPVGAARPAGLRHAAAIAAAFERLPDAQPLLASHGEERS